MPMIYTNYQENWSKKLDNWKTKEKKKLIGSRVMFSIAYVLKN